ncbi:MAG TPA: hypothetical protein VFM38_06580 [Candidatus Limnocylindrales bacterium]|nr:hypothetical protein [Candidatus Limnocylindrales bacterium]
MSRKSGFGVLVAALATIVGLTFAVTATPSADAHSGHGSAANKATFHDAMRQLWEDHIVWTRMFIVSAATESGDLPDIGPTTARLLANQTDIGDALKPFYGEKVGDQVTALLRDHILTAADLVAAAKAKDADAVKAASDRWYQNADDIATALHDIDPKYVPLGAMKAHMKDHLDLTLEEAVARLDGRYGDDIAAYDKIHEQILGMADMISDGIIKQFPGKFAS